MATSWNIPALLNKIATDVPNVNLLLKALLKWDVTGTEDIPSAAKRLASVTGGVQFQNYNGSAWASVGKLMHDVDMLDGYHASTSATANTIPIRNANGAIPGNITGNAATATQASGLTNDYVMPIANGGTGASTAAGARQALGTNNAANITTGVLATARGGTGRTDGMTTDVYLTAQSQSANSLGFFGALVDINGTNVDADSIVKPGYYYIHNSLTAKHWPRNSDSYLLDVHVIGSRIAQDLHQVLGYPFSFTRTSGDSGASWTGWMPNIIMNNVERSIYIAKDGSDTNSGLTADSPVLTVSRALLIANGFTTAGDIRLRFGPGEWGNVTIRANPIRSYLIYIEDYAGSRSATAIDDMPVFGLLLLDGPGVFDVSNIKARQIQLARAELNVVRYIEVAHIRSYHKSIVRIRNSMKFVYNDTLDTNEKQGLIWLRNNSYFDIETAGVNIDIEAGITQQRFIYVERGDSCIYVHTSTTFTGAAPTYKYAFDNGARVSGMLPSNYPGTNTSGSYLYNGSPQDCVHLTGDETIAGTKTFTTNPVVSNANPAYEVKQTDVVKGTAPSANHFTPFIRLIDNNGVIMGGVENGYKTNRENRIHLIVYPGTTDNNSTNAQIAVGFDASGNWYTYAPTPAANDNSTKIATTEWVTSKIGSGGIVATSCTGNSATATALQNTRQIWGQNFNGTANVTGAISNASSIEFNGVGSSAGHGGYIDFHYNGGYSDYSARLIEEAGTSGEVGIFALRAGSATYGYLTLGAFRCDVKPMIGSSYSFTLGTSSMRWTTAYLKNAVDVSSDERLKKDIKKIPSKLLDKWGNIVLSQFQYKEEGRDRTHTGVVAQQVQKVLEEAGIDPYEYGFFCYDKWEDELTPVYVVDQEAEYEYVTVSDAPSIMDVVVVEDAPEVTDKDGTVVLEPVYHFEEVETSPEQVHIEEVVVTPEKGHMEQKVSVPAGDMFSIRYEEFLVIEAAYQRRRADKLEQRVSELESRLAVIEQLLKEANVATQK